MVILHKDRGLQMFYSPDDGGGSGGGNPSGQNGGAEGSGGQSIKTPFDSLPWDELDQESQTSLKKAQTEYLATLQESQKLKIDLEKTSLLARTFQSEKDRLATEIEKGKTKETPVDPVLEAVIEELVTKGGYTQADAVKLAPVFAGMFNRFGILQKKQIGEDFAPMAGGILAGEARTAFQEAIQSENELGIFETPEVQQKVWDFVKERIKAGQPTDQAIVLSLGKMVWADHLITQRKAGKDITLPKGPRSLQETETGGSRMNTGGFDFPGSSSITPIANNTRSDNTPSHTLDSDTARALGETFSKMTKGMELKTLPQDIRNLIAKPTRGGRR